MLVCICLQVFTKKTAEWRVSLLKEIFVFAGKTLFFSALRREVFRTTSGFYPHSVRICSAWRSPVRLSCLFLSVCLLLVCHFGKPEGKEKPLFAVVPFRVVRTLFVFRVRAVRRRPRSGIKTSKLRHARIAYFCLSVFLPGNTRFSRLGIDNLTICQSPSEGSSGISGKSEGRHPPRANT